MAKKTSKNNDLLFSARDKTNPKIYSLILDLVNKGMEVEAREVLKIDYLLEYTSRCIRQRDLNGAKESLNSAITRINGLKVNGVDTSYLEYLYNGILKKLK